MAEHPKSLDHSIEQSTNIALWLAALPTAKQQILTANIPSHFCHETIVSAASSLTCRDDLDSKWRLLLAENELSRVSLLSRVSVGF